MKHTPDIEKMIESWLHDPSESVRQEVVKITVNTAELLRLVYQDESVDVRREALEQLAILSDCLNTAEREKLFHMVVTDYDAFYPLPDRRIYGLYVCPDCGKVLDGALKKCGLYDDALTNRNITPCDGNASSVLVCPRCGRKENYDFSVLRPDWLKFSFLRGSGRSDRAEKIIEKEIALLMEKLVETALHDKNWLTRRDAVEKLNDEKTLIRVALEDGESIVRMAAVKKINDTETLLRVALNDENKFIRLTAVQRIDYSALSAVEKKKFQHIFLHDAHESVRSAALEKISASDMDVDAGADNTSPEKPQAFYEKYGAMKDAEPLFQPKARGLLMLLKIRKELNDGELTQVHLHAQSVLKEESNAFRRAQAWWSQLPKTPDRQKENLFLRVRELDNASEDVQKWIDSCNRYEGLVYIFSVERKLNLLTNETESGGDIPVVAFNLSFGFRTMKDLVEDECVTYRMYFAYYE